ncbi:hypothetical protein BASA50_006554 [Batrachochytrium salamandrivorans]|uniref:OPA3-like protein n=1 Tax=Batrachochytrium salamandrivorans TaxID=1357716 RepID=A0ABQ8FD10_9FUNG|nr:hypothetical protein BASA62_009206 [Batrachochytrium salamandrivorans]KAH6577214.1 hypothetical protein BASA60_004149 [Batrachochytrium salamandrivorans]KAH6594605.1 hypothetical protein BASA50_006554 [Batrachochytrium salamandrivorans]KAH9252496.1 hypothetical protein BASA81_009539 [Batrachochytrium salamandrivorans]KAJ1340629.1 hypothetical protein BSLG_004723 [Batrachochytrium salamandrivorans]
MQMRFNDKTGAQHIRPLNDAKAVEVGANFMSESLLFLIAALTILGETWRTSRNTKNRSIALDESVDGLEALTSENQATIGLLNDRITKLQEELDALKVSSAVHQEKQQDVIAEITPIIPTTTIGTTDRHG